MASYTEARVNSDDTMADKAEVFKTACLKEFPFPEYHGERFSWRRYCVDQNGKKIHDGSH